MKHSLFFEEINTFPRIDARKNFFVSILYVLNVLPMWRQMSGIFWHIGQFPPFFHASPAWILSPSTCALHNYKSWCVPWRYHCSMEEQVPVCRISGSGPEKDRSSSIRNIPISGGGDSCLHSLGTLDHPAAPAPRHLLRRPQVRFCRPAGTDTPDGGGSGGGVRKVLSPHTFDKWFSWKLWNTTGPPSSSTSPPPPSRSQDCTSGLATS